MIKVNKCWMFFWWITIFILYYILFDFCFKIEILLSILSLITQIKRNMNILLSLFEIFNGSIETSKLFLYPIRIIIFQGWKVYDSSPKTIKCPLICLPPVSGTADIFFKQVLGLAAKGYRIISVSFTNFFYKLWDTYKFTCNKMIDNNISGWTARVLER